MQCHSARRPFVQEQVTVWKEPVIFAFPRVVSARFNQSTSFDLDICMCMYVNDENEALYIL